MKSKCLQLETDRFLLAPKLLAGDQKKKVAFNQYLKGERNRD